MSFRGSDAVCQDSGIQKATMKDVSSTRADNPDEAQTCTRGSCCGRCNCTCKGCRCSRTDPQTKNSNRTTYGNEGGHYPTNSTVDMSYICLQAASYSTTDSFPTNNILNEQAAPTPPTLLVHSALEQHVRNYQDEDMTRTRQMLTERYYDETIWDRRPWMNPGVRQGTSERSLNLSEPPMTVADSMEVNNARSNTEFSMYSTPSSRLDQRSVADSELIFGAGDGLDEEPNHFLILSPEISHNHCYHY